MPKAEAIKASLCSALGGRYVTIDKNFHSYQGMAGVYTLNAENVEAQKQIEDQQAKLTAVRKARDTATEEKNKSETSRASLQKTFQQECWDSAKKLRLEFDKTQDGKRRTKQFTDAVLAAKMLQSEPLHECPPVPSVRND